MSESVIDVPAADIGFQPTPVKFVSAFSDGSELEAPQQVAEEPKVQESAPVVEEPKVQEEPPKAEEPKQAPVKDRFSILSKRERDLQKQAEEIKAFKASSDWQQFNEFKSAKEEKDIAKKVEKLGLSIDDVTNYHLNKRPENPETAELSRKVSKLEADISRKEAERYQQQVANEISKFSSSMSSLIESDDSFELLRERSDMGMLLDAAEVIFQETGKIPSPKEVCEIVENILYEEEEARLASLAKTKKFASKLKANEKPVEQVAEKTSTPKEAKSTASRATLGNNSINKGTVVNEVVYLSDEERFQEAIKRLGLK